MDAAACIGCGACVAACPNGSAMLFTAAKISHLGLLPQGQPERHQRALRMVDKMEELGFGACSNHGECEAVCPKGITHRLHRPPEPRLPQGQHRRDRGVREERLGAARATPRAGPAPRRGS